MGYVLYSTEIQLRTQKVMVPPMSMYHLRCLLDLRTQGVNLDEPTSEDMKKIITLLLEVVNENHPELTYDQFEKELDIRSLKEVMEAMQSLPKNSTVQTGMMTPVTSPQTTS